MCDSSTVKLGSSNLDNQFLAKAVQTNRAGLKASCSCTKLVVGPIAPAKHTSCSLMLQKAFQLL